MIKIRVDMKINFSRIPSLSKRETLPSRKRKSETNHASLNDDI